MRPRECKAKEIVNQIKRRAQYSTPTVASANEVYEISDDYAVQLAMPKMLPALAHVPPAHVKASFELVIEKITDVIEKEQFEESVVEKMDELAIYFISTYIENPIVNKKRCSRRGGARTTNSVEGWHYGLQTSFSGSTPNISLLLRNLEKDSKMQKFKYVQETAGLFCSKRPRYEKIKKQMQNIRST